MKIEFCVYVKFWVDVKFCVNAEFSVDVNFQVVLWVLPLPWTLTFAKCEQRDLSGRRKRNKRMNTPKVKSCKPLSSSLTLLFFSILNANDGE